MKTYNEAGSRHLRQEPAGMLSWPYFVHAGACMRVMVIYFSYCLHNNYWASEARPTLSSQQGFNIIMSWYVEVWMHGRGVAGLTQSAFALP